MSTIRLHLSSQTLSDSLLQDRARALARDIERAADAKAAPETGAVQENAKGEPITLGVLLVTFMTSGAAVAALNVLKSYLERDRSLALSVQKPDGTQITLNAAEMQDVKALVDRILPEEADG